MKRIIKAVVVAVAALGLLFGVASCTGTNDYEQRKEQQNANKPQGETLEQSNLKKKIKLDEDANRVGYVYIMSFGKFVGYYTIKGKISSNGSQIAPEQEIICRYSAESCVGVDSSQDDGTYGTGDPGIFFFTTEGAMIVTDLDYLYSTQPVPNAINVPKLG